MRFALLMASLLVLHRPSAGSEALITSSESPADLANAVPYNVTMAIVSGRGVTQGAHAAHIRFAPGPWPNITFRIGQGFPDGDWRRYGGVAFDATNLEPDTIYLATRVDDDLSADGQRHCRTGWTYLSLLSQRTVTVEVTFDRLPEARRGPTILPGAMPTTQDGPVGAPLDWSHIVAFEIWLPGPTKAHQVAGTSRSWRQHHGVLTVEVRRQ